MSNSDQQDGVVHDVEFQNSNFVMKIDETTSSITLVSNMANSNDKLRLKKDDDKSISEFSNFKCWNFMRNTWNRRTVLERCLFLVTCGFAVFMIFMLVILPVTNNSIEGDGCTVCTSPACVSASARIMSIMDLSVDPCEDFYQYACGRWIHNNPIPTGRSSWSTLQRMSQEIQVVVKNIFDQPPETFTSQAEKHAHRYYQSCTDVNKKEELGGQPLLKMLDQMGGWPAGEMQTNWNFQKVLEITHNVLHSGGFFKWDLANFQLDQESNDSIHTIQLLPNKFSIPYKKSEMKESTFDQLIDLENFTQAIEKVLTLLKLSKVNVEQVVDDIVTIERQMYDMAFSTMRYYVVHYNHFKDVSLQFLPIDRVQDKIPFLNWNTYFQSAFSQVNNSITPSQSVLLPLNFFIQLDKFISTTLSDNQSGPRKLQNYLGWHVITTYLPYLSNQFRDVNCLLSPKECRDNEEIWRLCVEETNDVMSFAVGAMYVRQEFDPESKSLAASMVTAIKKAFENHFDHLEWMDFETRLAARTKAELMTLKIGYPEFILNRTRLDDFYKGLKVNSSEYFNNKVRSNQFSAQQHWMKLDKPFDKSIWGEVKPMDINAYYSKKLNQINLPVGGLKNPLFDISLPHSLNFGAMGVWIGHEITHGFDDTGRLFDWNGEERQWWNDATIERFNQQTECLIDQYSSYYINDLNHLDGQQTLSENIADNGGLKASFRAFTKWTDNRKEDLLTLPGLNLSHNQLFFLSFAQVFCASSTNEFLLTQCLADSHSPVRYRVTGALSNMIEFSSEFQCPSGSPMNPPNKCEVW